MRILANIRISVRFLQGDPAIFFFFLEFYDKKTGREVYRDIGIATVKSLSPGKRFANQPLNRVAPWVWQ